MSLLRSAATVGSLTMASRLLGFFRDMMTAAVVGTGPVAQAFVIAFRLPNMFRTLFAEGAFNTSFVPMFARRLEADGLSSARDLAEQIYAVMFAWLLLLTAVAQISMPALIHVIAPGYSDEPSKFGLSVAMTRIAFPSILFMSLTAVLGGMLNSLRSFFAASVAPIVLNLIMIAALAITMQLGWGDSNATGYVMVWSMCAGGIAQFLMVAYACRRKNIKLHVRWPRLTGDVAVLIKLVVPGLIAGGITQVNILISTTIATGIDRAVTYLYYAERIYQLPLNVIGVAIGIVLLPEMSRRLRVGDFDGAQANQNRSLEFAMFVTLPATLALAFVPLAIVNTFFERGAFTQSDAVATAAALSAFAAGLPAFTLNKVFSPGFFAREDTRSPMTIALVSVGCNIVGSLTLPLLFGHVGLALSATLAAWINTCLLGLTLCRRGYYKADDRLRSRIPRILLASLVMAATLFALFVYARPVFQSDHHFWLRATVLGGLLLAGSASYLIASHLLGAITITELRRMAKRI